MAVVAGAGGSAGARNEEGGCISSEYPVYPVIPVDVVRSDTLFFQRLYEYHFGFCGDRGVLFLDPLCTKKVRKAVNDTTVTARSISIS